MSFSRLKRLYTWRPTPNCPGRFVLQNAPDTLSIKELFENFEELLAQAALQCYRSQGVRDTVWVVRFFDGGLISYQRKDGSFCYTLNTSKGFERKLAQLGIFIS